LPKWEVRLGNLGGLLQVILTLQETNEAKFWSGLMTAGTSQISRGNYLIKSGVVITVDPTFGTFPKADLLVRNGLRTDFDALVSDIELL